MKSVFKFLIMIMSVEKVQELFLDMAEYLAKKTTSIDWDDEAVALFKKWIGDK